MRRQFARNKPAIRQRPGTNGKVRAGIDDIDQGIGKRDVELDIRVTRREFREVGQDMQPPERGGHIQPQQALWPLVQRHRIRERIVQIVQNLPRPCDKNSVRPRSNATALSSG